MFEKFRLYFTILFFCLITNSSTAQYFSRTENYLIQLDSFMNGSSLCFDANQDYLLDVLNVSIRNQNNELYYYIDDALEFQRSDVNKDGGNANGACAADIDGDGDLDVFVYSIFGQKNLLYIQETKGVFKKVYNQAWLNIENNAFHAEFVDIDMDNDPDILLSVTDLWDVKTALPSAIIYLNDGKGNFTRSLKNEFKNPNSNTRYILCADFDNDALQDLLFVNFGTENELYINDSELSFTKRYSNLSLVKADWMDALAFDIDNDADNDVLFLDVHGKIHCYLNQGGLSFKKVEEIQSKFNFVSGFEKVDINKDGKLDFILYEQGSTKKEFYLNTSDASNWISFYTRPNKSNAFGIGTKVWVHTITDQGSFWQFKEQSSYDGVGCALAYQLHFGVSSNERIDSIRVQWPDGSYSEYYNMLANDLYFLEQISKPKLVQREFLSSYRQNSLANLSVGMVCDTFRMGEISSFTIFYENKGVLFQDAKITLSLDIPADLKTSFPMPSDYNQQEFTWYIDRFRPLEKGYITLSIKNPLDPNIIDQIQKLKLSISSTQMDEDPEDNFMQLQKLMK